MRSKEATAERLKKTRASVNTSGLRFHRTACRGRPPGNCEVIPRNERRALELFCLTDGRAVSPDVSPTPSFVDWSRRFKLVLANRSAWRLL